MSPAELIISGSVIIAVLSFALVLGWMVHLDYTRPIPPGSAADDD